MLKYFLVFLLFILILHNSAECSYQVLKFQSDSLQKEKELAVYLPPAYSVQNKYPVVYLLHGFFNYYKGNYWEHEFQIKKVMGELYSSNKIKPFILVMPDGSIQWKTQDKIKHGFSFFANSIEGKYEDYLLKDIFKLIETNFSVIKNPEYRIVTGHSGGGLAAIELGCKYGNSLFRAVSSNSSPLIVHVLNNYESVVNFVLKKMMADIEVIEHLENITYQEIRNSQKLNDAFLDNLKSVDVYMTCGIFDYYGFALPNKLFSIQLKNAAIPHELKYYPGHHFSKLMEALKEYFINISEKFL